MYFNTFSLFLLFSISSVTFAVDKQADPLDSPSWDVMHSLMLNEEAYLFDNRVIVTVPAFAEDALNVPISVNVKDIKDIENMVVFADLNPIQQVLNYEPVNAQPVISFRIKVEQSTPVRAAVKTKDGIWHVGGVWLEAAGGGCTVSSNGMATGTWPTTLMNVSSRVWFKENIDRFRFRVMHPMDTGLADGVPEFYLQNINITDQAGVVVAKLKTYQPLSENPVFTIDVNKELELPLFLQGVDNNGNRLKAELKP